MEGEEEEEGEGGEGFPSKNSAKQVQHLQETIIRLVGEEREGKMTYCMAIFFFS